MTRHSTRAALALFAAAALFAAPSVSLSQEAAAVERAAATSAADAFVSMLFWAAGQSPELPWSL